jgi:hypothetical protein
MCENAVRSMAIRKLAMANGAMASTGAQRWSEKALKMEPTKVAITAIENWRSANALHIVTAQLGGLRTSPVIERVTIGGRLSREAK